MGMKFLASILCLSSASALYLPTEVRGKIASPRASLTMIGPNGGKPRVVPPPPQQSSDDSEKTPEQLERENLYSGADFEFDATSVTALLGFAIAFQFFVVANM